ncbi:MAG: hypothetical protein U5N86_11040 [Planctomycetota bacterium]|nr:hypothetical protein [Planctomycetota bacterium]
MSRDERLSNIVAGVFGVSIGCAIPLAMTALHIWTVYIAYVLEGIGAAVVTVFLPLLAQIYWFFVVGSQAGYGHAYCIATMIAVACIILFSVIDAFGPD